MLYTRPERSKGKKVKAAPAWQRANAVDHDGCRGATGAVCETGQPGGGELVRVMPGVWDIAADRVCVVRSRSSPWSGGVVRAESSSAKYAGAHREWSRRSDCGTTTATTGLGSTQVASIAAAARRGVAGGNDSPDFAAPRDGAGAGSASPGAATVRAGSAEPVVADGLQEPEGMESCRGPVVGAGRLQPLRGTAGRNVEHAGRSGARAAGERVSEPWPAGTDVNGPRHSVVGRTGCAGLDAIDGVADAVGSGLVVQWYSASADAGESGTVSWDAGAGEAEARTSWNGTTTSMAG